MKETDYSFLKSTLIYSNRKYWGRGRLCPLITYKITKGKDK